MAGTNKPGIAHLASDPRAAKRLPAIAQPGLIALGALCLARNWRPLS
jgi:hypothetical protein